MAQVANSTPVTVGAITAQWPLIRWTTSPSGIPPNTTIQTAVSTGARASATFTSSNSPNYRHLGVVQPDFLMAPLHLLLARTYCADLFQFTGKDTPDQILEARIVTQRV